MQVKRFFEIDVIRGVAILLVVFYHFIFDLTYFRFTQIELYAGFWLYFQRVAATLFVLIFGICISVSANRKDYKVSFLKRALKLGLVAALITLVTWVFAPGEFIRFGIIHFFAVATVLSLFFVKLRKYNLPIAFVIILCGLYLNTIESTNAFLLPFGVLTQGIKTLDYFPLLPWFGIVLIGMAIGDYVYSKQKFVFNIKENKVTSFLSLIGHHTLAIYLVHQPLIIAGLVLIGSI